MRIVLMTALAVLLACSGAVASEELASSDNFDGSTLGKPSGISYVAGKDGQAVALSAPSGTVEFPASFFPKRAGRIEFDLMFAQPISPDRTFWCLLSDVGAGSAFLGALNVQFRTGNNRLEYSIWSDKGHQFCYSKTSDWLPGRWYHIALSYGVGGMRLEVDGRLEDSNDCTTGLSGTRKNLGFNDAYFDSPPVAVDNLRVYRINTDAMEMRPAVVSPNGDGLFESSTITYELASRAVVTLNLTTTDGKLVKRLIDRKRETTGLHSLIWTADEVKDGDYDLRLTVMRRTGSQEIRQRVSVDTRWKWRAVGPKFNGYFPTGVFFFCEDDASYINRHIDDPAKARDYYEKTIADNAAHGVNLLILAWTPKDHWLMVLDIAHKHGVKVIVSLAEITKLLTSEELFFSGNLFEAAWNSIKDIRKHPALLGYYIVDEPEPRSDVANRILIAKKVLEAMDPYHPSFSCLLGGYEQLLETVDYQVLLTDIYPIVTTFSGDLSYFILEAERGQRNAGNRPLWVIPQAFGRGMGVWRIPTPEELRAQVWLALACGAKGILYFIYQSTTSFQGEWLKGLVDMDLKPMDGRWDEVAKINSDLRKLAPTLLRLKPAVFDIAIKSDKILARGFADSKGTRYAILANKDVSANVSAQWSGPPARDVLSGLEVGNQIVLKPGAGVLIRLH